MSNYPLPYKMISFKNLVTSPFADKWTRCQKRITDLPDLPVTDGFPPKSPGVLVDFPDHMYNLVQETLTELDSEIGYLNLNHNDRKYKWYIKYICMDRPYDYHINRFGVLYGITEVKTAFLKAVGEEMDSGDGSITPACSEFD